MSTKKHKLLSSPKNKEDRVPKRSKDIAHVDETTESQRQTVDDDDRLESESSLSDESNEFHSNDGIYGQQSELKNKKEDDKSSEDSQVIFENRCKLFRYDKAAKQNKERGIGVIQLLYYPDTEKYRCLMQRDQSHQLCADFPLFYNFKISPVDDTPNVYKWACTDFCDDPEGSEGVVFFARFRDAEVADAFAEAIQSAAESISPPTEEQLASAALAKAEHDAKKTKTVDFLRQFEESKASQENAVKLASLNVNGSENSSNSTLLVAKQAPSSPSSVFGSHISSKKPLASFADFCVTGKVSFLRQDGHPNHSGKEDDSGKTKTTDESEELKSQDTDKLPELDTSISKEQ